jgi:phosphoglycolate phosphatase
LLPSFVRREHHKNGEAPAVVAVGHRRHVDPRWRRGVGRNQPRCRGRAWTAGTERRRHARQDRPADLEGDLSRAEVAEHAIGELLPAAVAEAERQLASAEQALRERGEVIDGVEAVLKSLASRDGVRQTLVTGNIAVNAAVKLATFGLTGYFDVEVGAYGTDNANRNELVPIALERVERLRGERYQPGEVWVIGDTPGDFACARAAGVRCLLVATGSISMSELASLGADSTLDDLTETDAVLELLTS